MQKAFESGASADLRWIHRVLRARFGTASDAIRLHPTIQFVLSFIGSRTYDDVSSKALIRLGTAFGNFEAIASAPEREIEAVLGGVTFPEKKAPMLKAALGTIRARTDGFDLAFLGRMSVEDAHEWLEAINGVGPKIAAATLNFSTLRMRTFVVDTHVLRVLRRFGIVGAKAQTLQAHRTVMEAADGFDAGDLFDFHWQMKRLGQQICRHGRAACGECPLSPRCKRRF